MIDDLHLRMIWFFNAAWRFLVDIDPLLVHIASKICLFTNECSLFYHMSYYSYHDILINKILYLFMNRLWIYWSIGTATCEQAWQRTLSRGTFGDEGTWVGFHLFTFFSFHIAWCLFFYTLFDGSRCDVGCLEITS